MSTATIDRQAPAQPETQEELVHRLMLWGNKFLRAVAKSAERGSWDIEKTLDAMEYAESLLHLKERKLPKIDARIASVVQDKFVYGIVLAAKYNKPVPENFFLGQRQGWYPPLYQRTHLREAQR